MTKKEFAKQVFQLVQNSIEEEKSDAEIIDDVEIFLDTLEPRDREQFAKWGSLSVQVEPSKCWA
jgi:inhibitor of KinA sporulation pathway (predicted exonuclease)